MKKHATKSFIIPAASLLLCIFLANSPLLACTNILITKSASADGSTMVGYTYDCECYSYLVYEPAADHAKGENVKITEIFRTMTKTPIEQVSHTYAVIGTASQTTNDGGVGMINEHQLVIGETTFGGRKELANPDGALNYAHLMTLALQRCKTARDAINVMGQLVAKYGYSATGESFSIADTNEVWIMEMIGTGPGGKGALWVARKIPDGFVSCHANMSRIGQFPLNDPENCVYSENVISFAIEKKYYDPNSGQPFKFCDAYDPADAEKLRYAASRVWSVFRRMSPSQNFSSDYCRAIPGAEPYPLWIKADKKISVAQAMSLIRDHYEGTAFDMTNGIDAGPFGSPNRVPPANWKDNNGNNYIWERPVSTFKTDFSFVSQSRGWLDDPVGGIVWYGVDDTYTNCYIPLYCGIEALPKQFTTGNLYEYSRDSAWWIFNFVSNYANLRYCDMIKDIKAVQGTLEKGFLDMQPAVEKTAIELLKSDPKQARQYLTNYCSMQAELVMSQWQQLADHLIVKYNDGYIKEGKDKPKDVGYPQDWLERIAGEKSKAAQLRLPKEKD